MFENVAMKLTLQSNWWVVLPNVNFFSFKCTSVFTGSTSITKHKMCSKVLFFKVQLKLIKDNMLAYKSIEQQNKKEYE